MGAVLRLERFDHGQAPPAPLHTNEEIQDAYARGLIEGREQARSEQAQQLTAQLAALTTQLSEQNAAIVEGTRSNAAAMAPLLNALTDGVLPALARARLEAGVLSAFLKLAEQVSPLSIAVRCGPDLAAFVTACAEAAEVESLVISDDGPQGSVEAELLGGVMSWDEHVAAAQLRNLVREVMEES